MLGEESGGRRHVAKAFSWGPIWVMGWLFTIGFAHLGFWKGVLAILIWPFFLGRLLH
ncbi:MAG TPA: hypothetical protein VMU02_03475 [bacterium]|nr:hypothetical protein [bacterium]